MNTPLSIKTKPAFLVIMCLLFSITSPGSAQDTGHERDSLADDEDKVFSAFPFVISNPETGLAGGVMALLQDHLYKDDTLSRKSFVSLLGLYSLNNQMIFIAEPDLFFRREKFRIRASFAFNRIVDRFWGVGNDTPSSAEEDLEFNILRVEPIFYYKPAPNFFLGLQYRLVNQFRVDLEEGGLLANEGEAIGGQGSLISGIGPALLFDNRLNQINPSNGWYIEASSAFHHESLGSEFGFNRFWADVRHYIKLSKTQNHILALQAFGHFNSGEPPFKQMAQLGGDQMRGYFFGRFRDRQMLSLQTEYRSPLLFWRLSAVGFVGMGRVANQVNELSLNGLKPSFGGGLRIMVDKVDRLNVRIDMGFGEDGNNGIYFGLTEAF